MKTQVTTSAQLVRTSVNPLANLSARVSFSRHLASTELIQSLSEFFSAVLEEEVSPMQTLCLLNAVFALVMAVFPLGIPLVLRILFLLWFGIGLLQCRQADMGQ